MLRQQASGPALGDPSVVARPVIDESDGRLIRIGSQWLIDFRSPGPVETPAVMTERLLASLRQFDVATTDVAGHPVVEIPLAHDDETEALGAYRATLARERGRARSYYGAGRAAQLAGDHEAATKAYGEYLKAMEGGDGRRPELATARAFLQGKRATSS